MYDPRNSLTKDDSEQLANNLGEKICRTVIPRNGRLAEAPSYGWPALYYDKQSRGARAYLALASELARRYEGIDNAKGVGTREDSSGTDAAIYEKNRTQKQW